ncbi:MAG TPA: hypothetical protein PKA66_12155, partial [Gemmatimonadales bacterium]|nr:hypothetical protein [Gemmatimonadales bacterium]
MSRPVARMEVRRLVIIVVHLDYDTEEARDFGHGRTAWPELRDGKYPNERPVARNNAAVPPLRLPDPG